MQCDSEEVQYLPAFDYCMRSGTGEIRQSSTNFVSFVGYWILASLGRLGSIYHPVVLTTREVLEDIRNATGW